MKGPLAVLLAVLVAGCASIVSKSNYPVAISSSPNGATISITDSSGREVHQGTTPTTVNLRTKRGYFKAERYTIRAELEGHGPGASSIHAKVDLWYLLGNLLFGGLIGYLIVDPLTGAMWKYEDRVSVSLGAKLPSNAGATLHILTLDQLPEDKRKYLIPIEAL